mmetsp:Transcript_20691/g.42578  ORF Transcript_20691/g.42578 Transcript_20691/m.42578 type:complete len:103 (-) Transcript_20691:80-388(-)
MVVTKRKDPALWFPISGYDRDRRLAWKICDWTEIIHVVMTLIRIERLLQIILVERKWSSFFALQCKLRFISSTAAEGYFKQQSIPFAYQRFEFAVCTNLCDT